MRRLQSSNCTFMELKYPSITKEEVEEWSSNCTFMELK